MKVRSIIGATSLGLVLALAPMGGAAIGFTQAAFAKGGNGGGNGNGNGGGHGEGNSGHEKSGSDDANSTSTNAATAQGTSSSLLGHHADKHSRAHSASSKTHVSKPGEGRLSSLRRDYHAYLNSKDPKMAALSAYVKAYAEFEMQYGTTAVPTDPALSDNALRSALAQLSNKPVTDQTLTEAKSILGVGTNTGKIAEVRDALEKRSEIAAPSETDAATVN
ncbi:hypothetical protein PH562_25830 [Rhizobium sp. CNPSo 4062]|uniref:hypothetical protein n=1 Tax=Rhizobium sp. CNPSo 4062 TaxID=3021410 RepID=UPI00254FF9A7|nr:hypothetical protein [Rhizobium sp. CNPSo 4062]MDK4705689.1 hypothetical protein [Rhizobium sp. CNPSo 4062]